MAEVTEACGRGEWSRAIRALNKLLAQSPSAKLFSDRAFCHSNLELHKHALRDSELALDLDPSCAVAYLRKGFALCAVGKGDKALEAWRKGYAEAHSGTTDIELRLRLLALVAQGSAAGAGSPEAMVAAAEEARGLPDEPAAAREPAGGGSVSSIPSLAEGEEVGGTASATSTGIPPATSAPGPTAVGSIVEGSARRVTPDSSRGPTPGAEAASARAAAESGPDADGRPSPQPTGAGAFLGCKVEASSIATQHVPPAGPAMAPGAPGTGMGGIGAAGPVQSCAGAATQGSMDGASALEPACNRQKQRALSASFRIPLGIAQVNAGKYKEGIAIFNAILAANPKDINAYVGRGTALALQGKLDHAIADFTKAIEIEPRLAEAWKRRAQARGSRALGPEVIADLTRALELEPGSQDILSERGIAHYKLKDFAAAIKDLRACLLLQPDDTKALNYLGLAHMAAGDCLEAAQVYERALGVDSSSPETWTNMGQAYKEVAQALKAAHCFKRALDLRKEYVPARSRWGVMLQGQGNHRAALKMLKPALEAQPQNLECRYLVASCLHAVGLHAEAAREYDACLSLSSGVEERVIQYLAFYQREVAFYTASKWKDPLSMFQLDADLDPLFKEAWSKKLPPTLLFPGYSPQPICVPHPKEKRPPGIEAKAALQQLLCAADDIGRRIQNDCLGFLHNARQYRMAGLAAVEIAHCASATWQSMRSGWEGRDAPDGSVSTSGRASAAGRSNRKVGRRRAGSIGVAPAGPSQPSTSGRDSARVGDARAGLLADGWRDVYSMAVRWRQLSEPCDPVVWVDLLTAKEFEAGFGSHTPMQLGQTKVVRYSANLPRAFALMKEQMSTAKEVHSAANVPISLAEPNTLLAVATAQDLAQLWEAVGEDFWVTTPCYSSITPGAVLDGTRLTLQRRSPEGFDFSIRTPGTPLRWAQYDAELTSAWEDLCSAMCDVDATVEAQSLRAERVQACVLRLTFYWFNFMPLARGTAVVGHVVLLALMAAAGMEVTSPIPSGMQVDWEAILTSRVETFQSIVQPWLCSSLLSEPLFHGLRKLTDTVPTVGAAIVALSAACDKVS